MRLSAAPPLVALYLLPPYLSAAEGCVVPITRLSPITTVVMVMVELKVGMATHTTRPTAALLNGVATTIINLP